MTAPLEGFDLENAYIAAREAGDSEKAAIKRLAEGLSNQVQFDIGAARDQGVGDEEVLAFLIGRDPDDLRPDRLRTFGRAAASEAVEAGTIGLGGAATYKALGAAGRALSTAGKAVPIAGVPGAIVKGGLSILGAGLTAISGLPEEAEELLVEQPLGKRPVLPSELPAQRAGEVMGATLGLTPVARGVLRRIPEEVNLGSKKLMERHFKARNDALKGDDFQDKNISSPALGKFVEAAEKTVAGLGRRTRETGALGFTSAELGAAVLPAMAEATIISMSPGSDTLATLGGVAASIVDPFKITRAAGSATMQGLGAGVRDIRDKGLVQSAKGAFGAAEAVQSRREKAAFDYFVRAFEKATPVGPDGQPLDVTPQEQIQNFLEDLRASMAADPDLADVLTPGQLTEHPIVLLSEKTFAQGRQDLNEQQKRAAREASKQITELVLALRAQGTRGALQAASELERGIFSEQLQGLLDRYIVKAAGAGDRILTARGPTNVTAASEASELVFDSAQRALREARDFEDRLYTKIDGRIPINPTPIFRALLELQNPAAPGGQVLGTGDVLPEQMRRYLRDFGFDVDSLEKPPAFGFEPENVIKNMAEAMEMEGFEAQTSLSNILAFRRYLQRQVRQAQTAAEPINKAIFGPLDAATLDALGAGNDLGFVNTQSQNLRTALDYSRQLNNVFLRSFTGDLTRKRRGLRESVMPEAALDKLFTGGATRQQVNIDEIKKAFDFVDATTGQPFRGTVNSAVDFYIRNNFGDLLAEPARPLGARIAPETALSPEITAESLAVDGTNVRIDANKLRRFLQTNTPILRALDDEFGLIGDLQNVERAQVALESAFSQASQRAATNARQNRLSEFLKTESAQDALQQILYSKTPGKDLEGIIKRLRKVTRGGDLPMSEINDGLYSSLIDVALSRSTRDVQGTKVFKFGDAFDFLFNTGETGLKGFDRGAPSIMQLMQKNGVVNPEQARKLREFLSRGRSLEDVADRGIEALIDVPENDAMKDLVARVAGAQGVGFVMQRLGFTPTIQTTGAGAKFIKNQFADLPNVAVRDILIDVTRPGQSSVLADFLDKGLKNMTPRGLSRVYDYIGRAVIGSPSYLLSAPTRAVTEDRPEPVITPPPAPTPAPPPQASIPPPQPPALQQPANIAAPSLDRQRYAALYPNDPVSALIDVQGIGALPQAPRV